MIPRYQIGHQIQYLIIDCRAHKGVFFKGWASRGSVSHPGNNETLWTDDPDSVRLFDTHLEAVQERELILELQGSQLELGVQPVRN